MCGIGYSLGNVKEELEDPRDGVWDAYDQSTLFTPMKRYYMY